MTDCSTTLPSHTHHSPPAGSPYVGRFAPSPTGKLHFGSLLAALASYLDAKHNQGRWLVRVEDLDPPREVPGAAADILHTLEAFQLYWDGEVRYQSQQHSAYQNCIEQLLSQGLAYYCDCSRREVALRTHTEDLRYDGFCRDRQARFENQYADAAIRLKTTDTPICFNDLIQGSQQQRLLPESGDFVIRRRDHLYAYQLAVAWDDGDQGITHIVRGSDLLDSTPRQIYLQRLLGFSQPCYAHIPILLDEHGHKLSKQTQATALDPARPQQALYRALALLGQSPPFELDGAPCDELLQWAVAHWSLAAVPSMLSLSL